MDTTKGGKGKRRAKGMKGGIKRSAIVDSLASVAHPVIPLTTGTITGSNLLHAILRSSLSNGQIYNAKIFAYSRRSSTGIICDPLPIFVNSFALELKAPSYFSSLFSGGFQEGKSSKLDVDPPSVEESSTYDYGYQSDSDLEDDDDDDDGNGDHGEYKPEIEKSDEDADTAEDNKIDLSIASASANKHHGNTPAGALYGNPAPFLKNIAYSTLQSFIFYVMTGKIEFNPLRSQGIEYTRAKAVRSPDSAPPCSPKSMYRLAEMYGLKDLQDLALKDLQSKLSNDNIVTELFSSFTAQYTEIQEAQAEFLVSHDMPSHVMAALPLHLSPSNVDHLGGHYDVVITLLQKLAARLKNPSATKKCSRGCNSGLDYTCRSCNYRFQ